ncbi:Phox homologous domain-containing protein [Xylogone sp. PMI_703]|nr:Phox homologous domain-containing protein [Xylogone sp. PMI_703]
MSTASGELGSRSNGGAGVRSPVSPVTAPPYWVPSHQRTPSNISVESFVPGAITLQDNTESDDDKNQACWAKNVYIKDHVVINSSKTNIGAFVVWNIRVETLEGGSIDIRKRYSEFDDLRNKLLQTFPNSAAAMPPLPPKSVISKFRPKFLENRRAGLQYFLNCILLNPEFSGSPILKEFLFS